MEFEEFKRLIVGLFARYPSSQLSEATVPAWWAELRSFPREALLWAFKHAPRGHTKFCPSCETVREHAAAWRPPSPQVNFDASVLPEPVPEIGADLRAEFESIDQRVRSGELEGGKAGAAYLRAIVARLD